MSGAEMPLYEPSLYAEHVSGLVAVSLNCHEAANLATKILPATSAVYDRKWIYLIKGELSAEQFVDPVSDEAIVEFRDTTADFANVGALAIEADALLRAVARLAAFCLAKRHCRGVAVDDDESLIGALDDVADARVTERIIVWANGFGVAGEAE
jgi:hypothetical protein